MLDQVMQVFGITPHVDLDLMQTNQTLSSLTRRVLGAIDSMLAEKLSSQINPYYGNIAAIGLTHVPPVTAPCSAGCSGTSTI